MRYVLHVGSCCLSGHHLETPLLLDGQESGHLKILLSVFEMVDLPELSRISTGAFLNLEAPGGIRVSESFTF